MTQALTIQPGSFLWAPMALPSHQLRQSGRATRLVNAAALPMVQPGQLWFAVLPSIEDDPAPLEYRVVTTVNAVIYDRALAAAVARLLPLGGYAEPASPAGPHAAAERCLSLARDGWSVGRLVQPGREWLEEVRHLSALALSRKASADLPVSLFANLGGDMYENSETQLDELDEFIDLQLLEASSLLTVVYGAISKDAAPRLSAVSSNGLAG